MAFERKGNASAKLLVYLALRKWIRPVPHQGSLEQARSNSLSSGSDRRTEAPPRKSSRWLDWLFREQAQSTVSGKASRTGRTGPESCPAFRPFPDKNSQRHVESEGFRRKPGQSGAAVRLLKTAVLPNGSCQKSASQRTIRNKTDAQFFQRGKNLRLRFRHQIAYRSERRSPDTRHGPS